MRRSILLIAGTLGLAVGAVILRPSLSQNLPDATGGAPSEVHPSGGAPSLIQLDNPADGTLFPPELPPPQFKWTDTNATVDSWSVEVEYPGSSDRVHLRVPASQWTPGTEAWETIKRRSVGQPATLTVQGYNSRSPGSLRSRGSIRFETSKDEVGAPLFFREVNLPFLEAVKDPSKIRWRFGSIASPTAPPVVLEHLPVCGNCHSFSSNGQTMGMDVDYANSKGSYIITETRPQMSLSPDEVITWDAYRREDGELTFGLLSQVSPDGKLVVSTVKDKSVFVPRPDLAFSQLFFPIKGILVVFNRETRQFAPLPGADDPEYVQSNPVWSPDGETLVFARAKAYNLINTSAQGKQLLTPEECREFTAEGRPFQYDLYRIPYNGGRGGKPQPLEGASQNDQSNYFPRYSPDGKWIVFCKAANYMLLQPDSQLFIIPAGGGQARRLRANTRLMNSWHSWSPNSRWLVFSSKANSPYTQLFLTHVDAQGESTPPVVLAHLTAPDRAANIPEFVNIAPDRIVKIEERFLNDYSFERAANEFYRAGDTEHAIEKYRRTLELNPSNANAHQRLGFLLYNVLHQFQQGIEHTREALHLDPEHSLAHSDMGMIRLNQGQAQEALTHFEAALQHTQPVLEPQYKPNALHFSAAQACLKLGRLGEASNHLEESVRLAPTSAETHYLLALASVLQGDVDRTLQHYLRAVALKPGIDTSVTLHDVLSATYAKQGRFSDAVQSEQRALELAQAAGKQELLPAITARLERYKLQSASGRNEPVKGSALP